MSEESSGDQDGFPSHFLSITVFSSKNDFYIIGISGGRATPFAFNMRQSFDVTAINTNGLNYDFVAESSASTFRDNLAIIVR